MLDDVALYFNKHCILMTQLQTVVGFRLLLHKQVAVPTALPCSHCCDGVSMARRMHIASSVSELLLCCLLTCWL